MARLGPEERRIFEAVRGDAAAGLDALELLQSATERLEKALKLGKWCSMIMDPATVLPVDSVNRGWDYAVAHPLLLEKALLASPTADPARLFRSGARAVDVDSLLPTDSDIRRDPYYQYHLLPFGIRYEAQVMCVAGGRARAFLTLCREEGKGHFEARELRLLEAISPHIAAGVHAALIRKTCFADANSPTGLIVLDEQGRTELANAVGEGWLRWIGPTRWLMVVGVLRTALLRSGDADAPPPAVYLPDPQSGALRRLRAERSVGSDGRPRTMIFIEPARAAADTEALERMGLTRREALVAVALLRGDTLQEIASDLDCSPHTVNDHMKRVFEKVGVSSRRTLAARLAGAD